MGSCGQMRQITGLVALAFAWSQPTAAAQLVRDINQSFQAASGGGGVVANLAAVSLMVLDDGMRGAELWATDGTPAGTRLVRDINAGPASSETNEFAVINGIAYFFADDGTNGYELWRSDGTTTGTFIVADVGPGVDGTGGSAGFGLPIVTLNGVMYFRADDGQAGLELWRSDGTRSGTYRLADINPGPASSEPGRFNIAGSRLFFLANDGQHGVELWTTDGTTAGTHLVTDIRVGAQSSQIGSMIASGSTLFLSADDGMTGKELWRTNAAGTGAALVTDLNNRRDPFNPQVTLDSDPSGLIALGGGVVFTATTVDQADNRFFRLYYVDSVSSSPVVLMEMPVASTINRIANFTDRVLFNIRFSDGSISELYTTDRTVAGTVPLRPAGPLHFLSSFSFALGNGEAFFFARLDPPGSPNNIWRSDGTTAGTRVYATLAQPALPTELALLGNDLYFPAGRFTDPAGEELWVTDGTVPGTRQVADINRGPGHSVPGGMRTARGLLFFSADDGISGSEPWVTDGTVAGTVQLGDFNRTDMTASSEPVPMLDFNGGLLFVADDGLNGRELWFSDGTTGSTSLLADINPGVASSDPQGLFSMGGFVLFQADDGTTGRELWRTDGTPAGTLRVLDIDPGPGHGDPLPPGSGAVILNGIAYFSANDSAHGVEIWRSDGTLAGTSRLTELTPGAGPANIEMMGEVAGRALFRMQNSAEGHLWATDGTGGGTTMLRNDLEVTDGEDRTTFQGILYFPGRDLSGRIEVWRSDGTAAGTVRALDLSASGSTAVFFVEATPTTLFFNNCVQGAGCALYASDGTVAGTRHLINRELRWPVTTDGARYFFIDVVGSQLRLFVTDGTVAGTRQLLQGPVGFDGDVNEAVWFGGSLLFSAMDSTIGPAVWRTDAAGTNTRLFADVDPGVSPDRPPAQFLPVANKLFMSANHVSFGNELWVIDGQAPNAGDDSVRTDFNTTIRIAVLSNDDDLDGTIDVGSLQIVNAPSSGNASVDSSSGEIVYSPGAGFFGADELLYQVRDNQGFVSNTAHVLITVAAPVGQGPGTPPPPPPNPSPSGGGGGGGGAIGIEILLLSLLFLFRRRDVVASQILS